MAADYTQWRRNPVADYRDAINKQPDPSPVVLKQELKHHAYQRLAVALDKRHARAALHRHLFAQRMRSNLALLGHVVPPPMRASALNETQKPAE